MPSPTPDVDDEIQTAFLTAKCNAEIAGHGGTAYCWGIQAVMELLNERGSDRVTEALRRAFVQAKANPHNPIQAIIFTADEFGVKL